MLGAKPLDASEERQIREWLEPRLSDLFFAQSPADQRHGFQAATVVSASPLANRDVIGAAALHDVGKRHAGLGVFGRSVASVFILFRMPLSKRMKMYRDHGRIAADELKTLHAPRLITTFAANHHGQRPGSISSELWDLLQLADQPQRRV